VPFTSVQGRALSGGGEAAGVEGQPALSVPPAGGLRLRPSTPFASPTPLRPPCRRESQGQYCETAL